MAMKSFFMDGLHTITNESSKSAKVRNTSTNNDHGTVDSLQTKIKLLETENKLLKDDVKNKQKLINVIHEKTVILFKLKMFLLYVTFSLEIRWIKVLVKPLDVTPFEIIKRMSETLQRMKDWKNCIKDLHSEGHQPKVEKKNIVAIEDSMIKNVNGRDLSRGDSVKILSHPGASTEDLIAHIKPAVRKNPDIAVIHEGTNDLQNNCNIMKKTNKLVSAMKKVDKNYSVKIAFCSIINREDEDFKDKINDVNNKHKNYCNSAGMDFIGNSSITGSCLNRGKVHLNRKGTAALPKNLCRFVKSLPLDWIITAREGAFVRDEHNSLDNHSDISEMKNLSLKNPKNIIFSYLNINSIWNKFKNMFSLFSENIDIFIVTETKLDSSFPTAQFLIPSLHHPFRLDINRPSGGLLIYVKGSIPVRVLTKFSTPASTQTIVFKINQKKEN